MSLTAVNAKDAKTLPMHFFTTLPDEVPFESLKKLPLLSEIDKNLPGSPVVITVSLSQQNTTGGEAAGFASALLSGSTLGLIPIITNQDWTLRYDILVNKKKIASYSYTENFTETINIYAGIDSKLDKKTMDWIESTIPQLEESLQSDKALKELIEEYNFYF